MKLSSLLFKTQNSASKCKSCDAIPCSWGCQVECGAQPGSRCHWLASGTGRACLGLLHFSWQWCRYCYSAASLKLCLQDRKVSQIMITPHSHFRSQPHKNTHTRGCYHYWNHNHFKELTLMYAWANTKSTTGKG